MSRDVAPASERAYEQKVPLEDLSEREAATLIALHRACFRPLHAERQVNTLYFDSWRLDSFEDNEDGVGQRLKVRARWYGEAAGRVSPQLELKSKRGLVREKEVHPLEPCDVGADDVAGLLALLERAPLPGRARLLLAVGRPVLLGRYRRRYYASADGKHRLTLDRELSVRRCDPRGRLDRSVALPGVVIELKHAVDAADEAARVLQGFPWRAARSSKYAEGVRRLLGR